MERIEPIKPSLDLPSTDDDLDATPRDPSSGDTTQERCPGFDTLATCSLVGPELPQLGQQGVREEDIARTAALGDLGPQVDAGPGLSVREEDVAHVEAHEFTQT
jgi:hypothetical protein